MRGYADVSRVGWVARALGGLGAAQARVAGARWDGGRWLIVGARLLLLLAFVGHWGRHGVAVAAGQGVGEVAEGSAHRRQLHLVVLVVGVVVLVAGCAVRVVVVVVVLLLAVAKGWQGPVTVAMLHGRWGWQAGWRVGESLDAGHATVAEQGVLC